MREAVVMVHGLWMTGLEMSLLGRRLHRAGYAVHTFHYPSLRQGPRVNARTLGEYVDAIDADILHFVAHSLGGLVVLHLFDQIPIQRPGRVLFLGTPLKGSRAACRAAGYPLLGKLLLGSSLAGGLSGDLPVWQAGRELSMIAGTGNTFGIGRLLGGPLPQPHDGTVALVETQAPYLSDHLEVDCGHFGLLFRADVAGASIRFLRQGIFSPRPGAVHG